MKTAVLIHGCHLQAKNWENIVWGEPKYNVFGRAARGIKIAIEERAELIYWGTGASEKDGLKESQYTFNYAISHAQQLAEFQGFDIHEIDFLIESKSFIDIESQNTTQEVMNAMEMCRGKGVTRLILVSSPTHIARCLQSAERVRAEGGFESLNILATASDTCFANSTPADVLIVEPPHRGDRAEIPLHLTLKLAMFARKLDDEKAQKFNDDLFAFLEDQRRELMT